METIIDCLCLKTGAKKQELYPEQEGEISAAAKGKSYRLHYTRLDSETESILVRHPLVKYLDVEINKDNGKYSMKLTATQQANVAIDKRASVVPLLRKRLETICGNANCPKDLGQKTIKLFNSKLRQINFNPEVCELEVPIDEESLSDVAYFAWLLFKSRCTRKLDLRDYRELIEQKKDS